MRSQRTDPRLAPRHSFQRLFKNSGLLLAGEGVSSVLSLISVAITTRTLGAEAFGVLVLVQTYVYLIDRLVNFQPWRGLIKYGAEALDARDMPRLTGLVKLGTLLGHFQCCTGVIVALLGAALFGRILGWDDRTVQLTLISRLGHRHQIGRDTDWCIAPVRRISARFFAIQNAAAALVKLIAIAVAAYLGADLFGFVIVWAATDALGFGILVIAGQVELYRKGLWHWWRVPIGEWRPFIRFTVWDQFIIDARHSSQTARCLHRRCGRFTRRSRHLQDFQAHRARIHPIGQSALSGNLPSIFRDGGAR